MGTNRIQNKIKIILILILLQVLGCGSKEKKDIMGTTTTAAEKEATDKVVTKLIESLGGSQVKLSTSSSLLAQSLSLPDGWSGPDEEGYYTISTTKLSGGALSKLTVTLFKLKATSTADSSGSTTELFAKINYTSGNDTKGHIDVWDRSYQKRQEVGQPYNYPRYDDGTIKWTVTATDYEIKLTGKYKELPYQTSSGKYFPGLIINGTTSNGLQISIVVNTDYSGIGTITKNNGRKAASISMASLTSGYYTLESENNSKQYQFSLF